jgi:hypothetical protein
LCVHVCPSAFHSHATSSVDNIPPYVKIIVNTS